MGGPQRLFEQRCRRWAAYGHGMFYVGSHGGVTDMSLPRPCFVRSSARRYDVCNKALVHRPPASLHADSHGQLRRRRRHWDTSRRHDDVGMFYKASAFNQDIGGWAVHGSVTAEEATFSGRRKPMPSTRFSRLVRSTVLPPDRRVRIEPHPELRASSRRRRAAKIDSMWVCSGMWRASSASTRQQRFCAIRSRGWQAVTAGTAVALEPDGRRGGVRPHLDVGDWGGDSCRGCLPCVMGTVDAAPRSVLQRGHRRVGYLWRHWMFVPMFSSLAFNQDLSAWCVCARQWCLLADLAFLRLPRLVRGRRREPVSSVRRHPVRVDVLWRDLGRPILATARVTTMVNCSQVGCGGSRTRAPPRRRTATGLGG